MSARTQITPGWLSSIGWRAIEGEWPIYRSPESERGGPVTVIEWDPMMGCDGWRVNNTLVTPLETKAQVVFACSAFGIPVTEG